MDDQGKKIKDEHEKCTKEYLKKIKKIIARDRKRMNIMSIDDFMIKINKINDEVFE